MKEARMRFGRSSLPANTGGLQLEVEVLVVYLCQHTGGRGGVEINQAQETETFNGDTKL